MKNILNCIPTLNPPFQLMNIDDVINVWSMLELSDSRIAIGGDWHDGSIRIYSINFEFKLWHKDIDEKAHNEGVPSLCELEDNRLISASHDATIKIWYFSETELIHLKTLYEHSDSVFKIIHLSKDRLASGSADHNIKIWNNSDPYKEIISLEVGFDVYSLLQLKGREMLVNGGLSDEIIFWNLITFTKESSVKCCGANSINGLIELNNHLIAVNGWSSSSIDIIDSKRYEIVKHIKDLNYIVSQIHFPSTLCLVNENIFIYIRNGCFCEISIKDYKIVYKTLNKEEFKGNAMIVNENAKYFLIPNFQFGISVFETNLN